MKNYLIASQSSAIKFLKRVVNTLVKKGGRKFSVILPSHVYETSVPLALAMKEICKNVFFIPKRSTLSANPDVLGFLEDKGLHVLRGIDKGFLSNPRQAVHLLSKIILEEQFLIMDHGGYFAPSSQEIVNSFPREQFLGFTEHTLNGYRRYKRVDVKNKPIISIANSSLKKASDSECAESIAHMLDHMLRNYFGTKIKNSNLKIGVIGCGVMGSSFGYQCVKLGASKVYCADENPLQLILPSNNGIIPETIDFICGECDIILSATGVRAIQPKHYYLMKNNALLLTATSSDDELGLENLLESSTLTKKNSDESISTYKVELTGRNLLLVANGNAPNTLLRAGAASSSIFLTDAAQIAATIALWSEPNKFSSGLQNLPMNYEKLVAELWLSMYKEEVSCLTC